MRWRLLWLFVLPLLPLTSGGDDEDAYRTWRTYRGDPTSSAYSELDQINRGNVRRLQVAWSYQTEDAREDNRSTIECNPIIVGRVMYVTSPKLKVIALDAATGNPLWTFDPFEEDDASGVNRGVTYWEDGEDRRILFVAGPHLYALDADTGQLVSGFGREGAVDLRRGLGRDSEELYVTSNSPGIIYEDLIILGSSLGEGYDAAPGHVRAYDVRTGERVWTFHTIPQPGEFGYETWPEDAWKSVGGVNAWGGLSLDEARGLVFMGTGSPAFDFYGGHREGRNLFGNSVLALNAETGERVWHFQTVHHDLWDYDLPAPPNLVTVDHGEGLVDAVAQVTKMGHLFLFDRETGAPLFPVEERPVPPSPVEGEKAWPTQPFPVAPPPYARQGFTEADVTDISPEARADILAQFDTVRSGPIFTPPSLEGTIQLPGTHGGSEWGGAAFDPVTGLLYVNATELPSVHTLVPLDEPSAEEASLAVVGDNLFKANGCATCHGINREGVEAYPSLLGVEERRSEAEIRTIIQEGRGRMPAHPGLSEEEVDALTAFLTEPDTSEAEEPVPAERRGASRADHRYVHTGWKKLMDAKGRPGIKPPWGTLTAIDLNEGAIRWQVPLGEIPELTARGRSPTGTRTVGGGIVTAGGLVFIGSTMDARFRAFDKETGAVLWEYQLPHGGYATPSTYEVEGWQYVVIAAGGGGLLGTESGDAYIAFALPKDR